LENFQFEINNSQFIPKFIETTTLNTSKQQIPHVPIVKPHGIVGDVSIIPNYLLFIYSLSTWCIIFTGAF